jgi:hypothetical protein
MLNKQLRIEQSIYSVLDPTIVHKVSEIIEFYDGMIRNILGQDSEMANNLRSLKEIAKKLFFDLLNVQASHLITNVREPNSTLEPLEEVQTIMGQLVYYIRFISRNLFYS